MFAPRDDSPFLVRVVSRRNKNALEIRVAVSINKPSNRPERHHRLCGAIVRGETVLSYPEWRDESFL